MGGKCAKGSVEPCGKKKLYNARWGSATVKCGAPAQMLADGQNLTAGGNAAFTVKKVSDGSSVATANSPAAPSSVSGTWVSKKPTATWNGGEVKFSVVADGLTANSAEPHLAFHKYPDIAQASLTRSLQSPAPPAESKYRWKEMVSIELTDRKLILTVHVRLKNKSQSRPEQGKKESYAEYEARCESIPVGGAIPDADKASIKTAVERVYKDQWDLHRKDCGRGSTCDCDRAKKCCKFEIAVVLDLTSTTGALVNDVNLWPGTGRADSGNWYRIESRPGKSWAHEIGHLMGFYDEYPDGATGNSPWQSNAPASIMGSGTSVLVYHFEEFRAWLSTQEGEQFELIRHT